MKHIASTALFGSIAVYLGVLVLAYLFRHRDTGWGFVLWLFLGGFVCAILWGLTCGILTLASIHEGMLQFVLLSGILGMLAGAILGLFFGGVLAWFLGAYMVIVAIVVVWRNLKSGDKA